jgi:protein involved in polysaccharide export with SLBB domain
MAGGFTEYANTKKVTLIRDGKTIIVDCKKALQDPAKYDVPVFPGDSINVKKGWF